MRITPPTAQRGEGEIATQSDSPLVTPLRHLISLDSLQAIHGHLSCSYLVTNASLRVVAVLLVSACLLQEQTCALIWLIRLQILSLMRDWVVVLLL